MGTSGAVGAGSLVEGNTSGTLQLWEWQHWGLRALQCWCGLVVC